MTGGGEGGRVGMKGGGGGFKERRNELQKFCNFLTLLKIEVTP